MVDVAQLVRAPVCGTGGRGFKSRHPPHLFSRRTLGGIFNAYFPQFNSKNLIFCNLLS